MHIKGGPILIETARFILRELTVEDVSDTYLNWLNDSEVQKWIVAASKAQQISDLKQYVSSRVGRKDVLFLGIFDKGSGVHVGNIKYEPICPEEGSAVMGILIGDASYRGKGVFAEVFIGSAAWLKKERQIFRIYLGVKRSHKVALSAYEKVGFLPDETLQIHSRSDILMMVYV